MSGGVQRRLFFIEIQRGQEAERYKSPSPPIFVYYEQACTYMVQANKNLERIKSDSVTYCESLSEQNNGREAIILALAPINNKAS